MVGVLLGRHHEMPENYMVDLVDEHRGQLVRRQPRDEGRVHVQLHPQVVPEPDAHRGNGRVVADSPAVDQRGMEGVAADQVIEAASESARKSSGVSHASLSRFR